MALISARRGIGQSRVPKRDQMSMPIAAADITSSTGGEKTPATNSTRTDKHTPTLSARQGHCLYLSANGLTDEEVAAVLGLTMATVRFHFAKAQQRLGARNRRHAIFLATISGLLTHWLLPERQVHKAADPALN